MNAMQKLWQALATRVPADELATLQAQYRADAAADSRASYARQRKRQDEQRQVRICRERPVPFASVPDAELVLCVACRRYEWREALCTVAVVESKEVNQ